MGVRCAARKVFAGINIAKTMIAQKILRKYLLVRIKISFPKSLVYLIRFLQGGQEFVHLIVDSGLCVQREGG